MNIDFLLKQSLKDAFKELFNHNLDTDEIKIQPTRKEFKGSHTFVTFPYLQITRKSPEDTGRMIGEYLRDTSHILDSYNVVKGFLNLDINDQSWMQVFETNFNNQPWHQIKPKGKKVMVEYSSPNTNKPLHLGHLRNNFLGFSISEILMATGYEVRKANLINDRGIHICKSMVAYQKYGNNETPESSGLKGDHLIGKYYVKFEQEYKKEVDSLVKQGMSRDQAGKQAPLMQEAKQLLKRWEQKEKDVISLWEKLNNWAYDGFEKTYDNIGVGFDQYYYESNTYVLGKDIIEEGLSKKIFYRKEDGSVWVDLSDDGLDEKLLLRSDGTSVYMTQDLGTADLKYRDFPFDQSIYVVGNEQDYHFKVLFTILKKLGRSYADEMYHLSYGMVDLPTGKMKSREGTVVDADDLVDEMIRTSKKQTEELGKVDDFDDQQAEELYKMLAMGALKYFLLKIDPKKRMLFNPEESIQFQGNTGPFIQYTHARISSILRKAQELEINFTHSHINPDWNLHETEKDLIIGLSDYQDKVAESAFNHDPSVIANFCYDIAKFYNRFYTEVSIFNERNPQRRDFRVALSIYTAKTIRYGMRLLGIKVPERM